MGSLADAAWEKLSELDQTFWMPTIFEPPFKKLKGLVPLTPFTLHTALMEEFAGDLDRYDVDLGPNLWWESFTPPPHPELPAVPPEPLSGGRVSKTMVASVELEGGPPDAHNAAGTKRRKAGADVERDSKRSRPGEATVISKFSRQLPKTPTAEFRAWRLHFPSSSEQRSLLDKSLTTPVGFFIHFPA